MKFSKEINTAISENLRLKSKILSVIFSALFLLQISVMLFSDYFAFILKSFDNKWIILAGPGLIATASVSEIVTYRYICGVLKKGRHLSKRVIYFISFVEISFPSAVLLFLSYLLAGKDNFNVTQLLNSPPVIIYFVMIILSSLTLDYRISLFAGLVASIEYCLLCNFLLGQYPAATRLDFLNCNVRSVFIFLCSAIAAFVSYKIKEAVLSSIHSKDELINRLDHLVHEKTQEIREQKNELEQKNKDITDSINYARRIQHSQMPTEKYIQKHLLRLGKK